jgi:hypothetical protein
LLLQLSGIETRRYLPKKHKNTVYLVVELEDDIIDDYGVKLEERLKVCSPEIHPG